MGAQEIEYVELYANDERSAVDYFVSCFGFTTVAEHSGNGTHSSLLRQGTAQIVVTGGRGTEEFLESHGDGVADIAFACDDTVATREMALAEGASLVPGSEGQAVSGGFGVRHTLVPRSASTRRPPADRTWVPVTGEPARTLGHVRLLDHVAVCIESGALDECADFYTRAFGLPRYSGEYIKVGDQAMDSIVVRSSSGGITFTILEQDLTKKSGQVEAFLSRNAGSGVQHLAFLVDDIVLAVREYGARGVDFLYTPDSYYEMLADRLPGIRDEIAGLKATSVLADRDEWGYLLQLFTRSPYKRNTMFYELVQRRGARGFGSANIQALYEAVERDKLAGR